MKLLNIILAILILALAGTTLFFAQQLHIKRYQVKVRGDEMAKSIQKLVKGYDDILSLKYKDKIQADALNHTHDGSEVASTLRPLNEQYNVFVNYKTETLEKMQKLMSTIDLANAFDLDKASKIATVDNVAKSMPEATTKLKERNDGIVDKSITLGSRFAIEMDEGKLNNIDDFMPAKADFDSMNANALKFFEQLSDYERSLNDIAEFFKQDAIDFGDEKKDQIEGPYVDAMKNIIAIAQKVPTEISETKNDIESLSSEISSKEESSKELDDRIKTLKSSISKLNTNIDDLRAFLTQEWPSVKPWKYNTISVNIIDINDEGTRMTLDWGKTFKHNNELLPPTLSEFVVALAGDHKGVNNFGRIVIDTIEDNKAFARVITLPSIKDGQEAVYQPQKSPHLDFVPMSLLVFDASKTLETVYRAGNAKVMKISPDRTFVVINWGKNFKVQQAATTNLFPAPMLGKYDLTAAAPNTGTPNTRLSVVRVEDDYSIANIASTPIFKNEDGTPREIAEGDIVNIVPAFIPEIELATAKSDFNRRKKANSDDEPPPSDLPEEESDTPDEMAGKEAEISPTEPDVPRPDEDSEEAKEAVYAPSEADEKAEEATDTPDEVETPKAVILPAAELEPANVVETKNTEIIPASKVVPAEKVEVKKSKGFWSSLFDWSDDEEQVKPTEKVEKSTEVKADPKQVEKKSETVAPVTTATPKAKGEEKVTKAEIIKEDALPEEIEEVVLEVQPEGDEESETIDEEDEDKIIVPEDEEVSTTFASYKANINTRKSEVIPPANKE